MSFQSGNVLFLGLGAGTADGGLVIRAGASLAAFVIGAAVGSQVIRRSPSVLAVEALVLTAFAAVWLALATPADHPAGRVVLIVLGATAMGIQVALTLKLKVPNVLTVALTGTIAVVGQRIGDGELHGQAPPTRLLVTVCSTYAVCALLVALLPETSALSVAPLTLLAVTVALDPARRRTWQPA